jgi:hypothetical protein
MPTAAVGMFFRENNGMATLRGHGTRYTDDETALLNRRIKPTTPQRVLNGKKTHPNATDPWFPMGRCEIVVIDVRYYYFFALIAAWAAAKRAIGTRYGLQLT